MKASSNLDIDAFFQAHRPFLGWLMEWFASLESIALADVTANGACPRRLAILSEDLVKGFTTVGRLASPRIAGVVPEVVRLLQAAYALGVRDFVLPHDSHPPDSPEFDAYGPHCVTGTVEAEMIDELAQLPFADHFTVMPKQSLNPAFGTDLDKWIDDRPGLRSIIVVGDCTDLCVYQAAMHLKIRSNWLKRGLEVIVPEDCVQTYDLPVQEALADGVTPHDADLMHILFLYHMALNDIRVVRHID